jgi:hypothetical protein
MQGIIFNALEEFVLENAGMEVWNSVIDDSGVVNGAYTSGVIYDDSEIVALASTLCEKLDIPLNDGVKFFGVFLFDFLLKRVPIELKNYQTSQQLLADLEDVIHRDVKRLHSDAYTPFLEYTPSTESKGVLIYRSKRKLCSVAEGLIQGMAKHFSQEVTLSHSQCMHDDHNECKWDLVFS